MLVRNLGAERFIASPTHEYESAYIDTGETVDVPDAVGRSLCEQDGWEPADEAAAALLEAPAESAKDRKARLKAEAEAAWANEVASAAEKVGE